MIRNSNIITRDPQGNPLIITRPNNAGTTMTYDANGNLLTLTDPRDVTTRFTYDALLSNTSSHQSASRSNSLNYK